MIDKSKETVPMLPSQVTFLRIRRITKMVSNLIIGVWVTLTIAVLVYAFSDRFANPTEDFQNSLLQAIGYLFTVGASGMIAGGLAIVAVIIIGFFVMKKQEETEPKPLV